MLPEEEAQQSQSLLMLFREAAPKDELLKMIGDLKGKIEPWRVDALATLKKNVDAIHSCTTAMEEAVAQWPEQKSQSDEQGVEHASCREEESEKFNNKEHWKGQTAEKKEIMDTECKIFEDVKKEIREARASYSSGDEEAYLEGVCDEFNALLPRFESAKKKCTDAKAEHVRVSELYKQAESSYTTQSDGCNERQTETEVSYCQYALATKGTCDSYGTCYEDKVSEYKSVEEIIKGEEKLKKIEYRVYSRIECPCLCLARIRQTRSRSAGRRRTASMTSLTLEFLRKRLAPLRQPIPAPTRTTPSTWSHCQRMLRGPLWLNVSA